MNQLLLVGRLTRPVEDRQVGDHRVVNNCLAVSRRHRDRNGDLQTDFIPIVAWDYLADLLVKYAQKGHRIGVVGRNPATTPIIKIKKSTSWNAMSKILPCLRARMAVPARLAARITAHLRARKTTTPSGASMKCPVKNNWICVS